MEAQSDDGDVIVSGLGLVKSICGRPVVKGVDITLRRGRIYALLGPNGAGKTTTTRLLTGILHPDSGGVSLFGEALNRRSAPRLRRRIGMQVDGAAYEDMTIADNINLWLGLYGMRPDPGKVDDALATFGLEGWGDVKAGALSKGNRQKVLMARALAVDPDILFLDEPTTGLDPEAADALMELLHERCELGLTVFMCTHRLQGLAGLVDDVGFIRGGEMLESGDAASLLARHWPNEEYSLKANGDVLAALDGAAREVRTVGDGEYSIRPLTTAPEIVRRLVAANVDVYDFEPVRHDIHDLYLEVVGDTEREWDMDAGARGIATGTNRGSRG